MTVRRRLAAFAIGGLIAASADAAMAQTGGTAKASLHGQTTTQSGAVALPGVTIVVVTTGTHKEIDTTVSDGQGRFRFAGLLPGDYDVQAVLGGFLPLRRTGIHLSPGDDVSLPLDIVLALATTVNAVAAGDDAPITGSSQSRLDTRLVDVAPLAGDDYQALLPLVPGVVRGIDGRITITGGRPTDTGQLISQAYANDPVTGAALTDMPVDALAAVEVLPNPYAAEFGRFASGMVRLETRKGGDVWRTTANNFVPIPCLKLCDGSSWGVRSFDPRLLVTGPVVSRRVFLALSLQYHDHKERVTSLPRAASDTGLRSLNAFARIDATAGRHTLTGTAAFSPELRTFAGLDTFHPQHVSPDVRRRADSVSMSDTWRRNSTTFVELTLTRSHQRVSVVGRGSEAMTITPEGVSGSFFDASNRRSVTTQAVAAFSTVRSWAGDHALKAGIDVLGASFDGVSRSRDVEIRREDGTLSERLGFGEPTALVGRGTDVAVFAQDRWRANDRVLGEAGVRLDRDGVSGRTEVSPRLGFVVSLLPGARSVIRGGIGRFIGRTPLLASAFAAIDAPLVTYFGVDGVAEAGASAEMPNVVSGPLMPSKATVWNVEYDHRLRPGLLLKLNHLERDGRRELLVDPVRDAAPALALSSTGRSQYRATEATVQYARSEGREISVTYVRSQSRADLNGFDAYFGTLRQPVVRDNAFGPSDSDVPNRLLALAILPIRDWTISPLVELRNGFPFSARDEEQNFAGSRNAERFPFFASFDLSILRVLTIRGHRVRVGFRSTHLLGTFTPRDVQDNLASPLFGAFYNPIPRRIGLTVELLP